MNTLKTPFCSSEWHAFLSFDCYSYVIFPSPHSVPSAPPQNVRGNALSSSALRVTWNPPPIESQHGTLRGYKIRYAAVDEDTDVDNAPQIVTDAETHRVDIRDLRIWTQYKIWVAPFTQVGDGPFSDVIIVQTDEDGRSSLRHACLNLVVETQTNKEAWISVVVC